MMAAISAVVMALVMLGLVFVGSAGHSYACSCVSRPTEEVFEDADAVFSGKVVGITPRINGYNIIFEVYRYWKGLSEGDATVVVWTLSLGAGDCGFPFEQGDEYLTYAEKSSDTLEVDLCSGTQPMPIDYNDLAAFGSGTIPDKTIPGKVISVDPGAISGTSYMGIEGAVPAIIVAAIAGLGAGIAFLVIRKK